MLLKQLNMLVALLILSLAATAQAAPPNSDADAPVVVKDGVRIYEVKKGDTLWGISKRFIEDPYYWPDLWANNPEIRNPHFIFPKQQLKIYSGPIMVVTAEPKPVPLPEAPVAVTAPAAVETPAVVAPPAEPVKVEPKILVSTPAGVGYISSGEVGGLGEVYDFHDSRQMAASGDSIFIRLKPGIQAKVGDRFQILTTLDVVRHPVTKKEVGFQVIEVGSLEVTAIHDDVSEARIVTNYREIERGAVLVEFREPQTDIALKRPRPDLRGVVLSSFSSKTQQGQNDVVYLSLGSKDGLDEGNVVDIMRPRKASDAVKVANRVKDSVRLPDEPLGEALVVEVKNYTATAVIMKSVAEIRAGDLVVTPGSK